MHELFMSENSVNYCDIGDALVHYSTTRPLLVLPTVRTSLTDYNSVRLFSNYNSKELNLGP